MFICDVHKKTQSAAVADVYLTAIVALSSFVFRYPTPGVCPLTWSMQNCPYFLSRDLVLQ